MRIWFDTEFIEDGKTIELLSIGLVRESDDAALYIENAEADRSKAGLFVRANVLPKLDSPGAAQMLRGDIAQRIHDFVGASPEFWGYYADYDWVVLCQLYGRMIDLPHGWPMFCRDFKQLIDGTGFECMPIDPKLDHHALHDAQWLREQHRAFLDTGHSIEARS
jgi:hypothetical protein